MIYLTAYGNYKVFASMPVMKALMTSNIDSRYISLLVLEIMSNNSIYPDYYELCPFLFYVTKTKTTIEIKQMYYMNNFTYMANPFDLFI